MGSLAISTDAGAAIDPDAADVPAQRAWCNADVGIIANALHLARTSFGINIENSDGGRAVQYILSEPDGSAHTDPSLAKGFQVQVLRPNELRDPIQHYGPLVANDELTAFPLREGCLNLRCCGRRGRAALYCHA